MKKVFLAIITLITLPLHFYAQDNVAFEITEGALPMGVKANIERNTAKLLTAINTAESTGQDINFGGIGISDYAANSIAMYWANVHFRIIDDDIVERCNTLRTRGRVRGYDVGNIAVEMKPFDASYEEDINQEINISYDTQGKISDLVISMGMQQYSKILKNSISVEDLDERMQIMHFVEQFANAYGKKDISFMNNVFSDNALIITGHRVLQKNNEMFSTPAQFEYTKQDKQQYLAGLKKVFARNAYVNVKFEDIEVERNESKPYIYGVTCTQRYYSSSYHDVGKLTMIWNFSNPDKPEINVRVWQACDDPKVFSVYSFKSN